MTSLPLVRTLKPRSIPIETVGVLGALLCALMLAALPVLAQGATGSVEGVVRDAQKQPVVGAKVWLDDQVEGRTTSVSTDAAGHFRFEGIAAGTYMVRAQKSGYRDSAQGPIALKGGEAATVNFQMAAEASGAAAGNAASARRTPSPRRSWDRARRTCSTAAT